MTSELSSPAADPLAVDLIWAAEVLRLVPPPASIEAGAILGSPGRGYDVAVALTELIYACPTEAARARVNVLLDQSRYARPDAKGVPDHLRAADALCEVTDLAALLRYAADRLRGFKGDGCRVIAGA